MRSIRLLPLLPLLPLLALTGCGHGSRNAEWGAIGAGAGAAAAEFRVDLLLGCFIVADYGTAREVKDVAGACQK